jgi:hypothetical protein
MPVRDDNLMDRFDRRGRHSRARDALVVVAVTALLLVAVEGSAIRTAGEQSKPGVQRDVLVAVGGPAGWVADRLPLHSAASRLTSGLSPDMKLADVGGFDSPVQATSAGQLPQVTASAFDPAAIGAPPPPRRALKTLLVSGDSLSTPLDIELARRLTGRGVRVIREPHLGTGISKVDLVDWGKLSVAQTNADHPDAVVMFIGANEGFPMRGAAGRAVSCCGAEWAAIYANRVRQMMNTYRRNGRARVYWVTIPTPRDAARQRIERVVNEAIAVAAEPWRDAVRIIDTVATFTPGERYRDAMAISGRRTIVRESDGIHLNRAGAALLAQRVLDAVNKDYRY